MKIIQLINQNLPIWSVIKGDHACSDAKNFLGPKLLSEPDLLCRKENALRLEYLKNTHGRRWLHDLLANQSFALVQLQPSDLEKAITVWDSLPIMKLARKYRKAYSSNTGFAVGDVEKSKKDVIDLHNRKVEIPHMKRPMIVNPTLWADYHRTIWMIQKDGTPKIVDGTHRVLATAWKYTLEEKAFPEKWYGIMFRQ